jgi:hypothetical protein
MAGSLKYTAIICNKCDNVLDVLKGEISPLYTDKICKCGSLGFYTQIINVRVICNRPDNEKPFFKTDGGEFYK